MYDNVAFDILVVMPAGIAGIIFLATVGGWGFKRKSR